jgi:hypothetical protein
MGVNEVDTFTDFRLICSFAWASFTSSAAFFAGFPAMWAFSPAIFSFSSSVSGLICGEQLDTHLFVMHR